MIILVDSALAISTLILKKTSFKPPLILHADAAKTNGHCGLPIIGPQSLMPSTSITATAATARDMLKGKVRSVGLEERRTREA